MRCSRAKRLISDHVDKLLETGQVRRLESHLRKCADCRAFLADMESIVNNAKELDILRLSEDLWPAINRQVLKKNRESGTRGISLLWNFPIYHRGLAFALSSFLVVIILIPLIYHVFSRMESASNNPAITALNHFKIVEQNYKSAILALDQAIKAQDVELVPDLMEVFKNNLEIIEDSIRICKAAVEQYPENPEANKLLLICYTKKIEILTEIKNMTIKTG